MIELLKVALGSRGMQLKIIGEDMPTLGILRSIGTGLSSVGDSACNKDGHCPTTSRASRWCTHCLEKPAYARCWMFGESIQKGKGTMLRVGISVPNLPSSKFQILSSSSSQYTDGSEAWHLSRFLKIRFFISLSRS
jgi:hypothetical protein